jgi:hypothetical protein
MVVQISFSLLLHATIDKTLFNETQTFNISGCYHHALAESVYLISFGSFLEL